MMEKEGAKRVEIKGLDEMHVTAVLGGTFAGIYAACIIVIYIRVKKII